MTSVPPIRREVLVEAGLELAFEVFTARIGVWWPLVDFSVHGAGATVSFSGDRLVERSPAGEAAVWGTVTRWEPPHAVAFTWHPGAGPDRASDVAVTFTPAGEQTLVTLEHNGWESFEDPAAARAEYGQGWPAVLEAYREAAGAASAGAASAGAASGGAASWVALVHRPGPGLPRDYDVFSDPRFGQHIEFLARLRERGYLVAAGPLIGQPGTGMTILRLPGAGLAGEAARLATEDDPSVAGGLFSITISPWQVMLEA
jgi:uncharacterized protein YndB with AHSA1/START domain/uncharacterized protein YciI